jgi:hypothetical protein
VSPVANLPDPLDPQKLAAVLAAVHAQVVAALWLSAGMILAFAAIGCMALAWRRSALACGFGYSLTLCFLANGHAQLLGPAGCAIALTGFLWPQRKPAPPRPRERP